MISSNRRAFFRLAVMMSLYYFSMGLIIPMLSIYLTSPQYLGLSSPQAGLISAMQALAVIVSPLIGVFITDRLIHAHHLFALLQILSGLILFFFPFFKIFPVVLFFYALYEMLFLPGTALTNTILFHHLGKKGNGFGAIRLWGTLGWIFAGVVMFVVGKFYRSFNYAYCFFASGIASFFLGLFSFFYLKTPQGEELLERGEIASYKEKRKELLKNKTAEKKKNFASLWSEVFPLSAFKFILRKEILLILLISVLVKLVDRYYYFGGSPFLAYQGADPNWVPGLMAIGNISEVIAFIFLGRLLSRFGYRFILLLGILSELIRFLLFAFSPSFLVSTFAFPFHGISFACFSGTAYIFINEGTDFSSRAGVQHLYALITGITGNFLGCLIPGLVIGATPMESYQNYRFFWLLPAGLSLLAVFLTFFLPRKEKKFT